MLSLLPASPARASSLSDGLAHASLTFSPVLGALTLATEASRGPSNPVGASERRARVPGDPKWLEENEEAASGERRMEYSSNWQSRGSPAGAELQQGRLDVCFQSRSRILPCAVCCAKYDAG